MSGWFPRLSPSGRRVASGDTVIHVDGVSLGLPGTTPQWFDESSLLYAPQPDGPLQIVLIGERPNDARIGVVNPAEYHTQNLHIVGYPATTSLRGPTVSRMGAIAGVRDIGGGEVELVLNGVTPLDRGFIFNPRFSGDVLVWSKVVDGVRRTYGRRGFSAPIELLSVDPSRDEFWPIAIETPAGLFILNHGHDRCFVRAWGAAKVIWSYVGVTDYPDARWDGALIRIVASERGNPLAWFADVNAPEFDLYPVEPPQPPAVDPWELVPDGTLVSDAFRAMFGDAPCLSPDGLRICLHKNINEQEWRELGRDGGVCFHLFDRSRYPGDVGWYLWSEHAAPIWAADVFESGVALSFSGEIVEMKDGRRNRWTHTNTLYGLTQGGVCVQFDPRFPGHDYGPEKCYERMFNSPLGLRWELWYSPEAARSLPWGDRSLDVLKQAVESGPPVAGATPPYIECPRLSVTDDPWAQPQPPDPPTPEDEMTTDDLRRWAAEIQDQTLFGAMQRYHNEVLPRDRPLDGVIKNGDGDDMWTGDVVTGGANGYLIRTIMTEYFANRSAGKPTDQAWGEAYDAAKRSYDRAVNPPPPVTPGVLAGPISVSGKDLTVPDA